MKLDEIAEKITDYLKRFENDPVINNRNTYGQSPYYCASAWKHGRFVAIRYVCYQPYFALSKAEALAYLAWLKAGNIGKHWDVEKDG